MGYMEDYEDYITPKPVPYETYELDIAKKDEKIEELQNKIDDLNCELNNYKQTLEIFKNEVRKYENIQKGNKA